MSLADPARLSPHVKDLGGGFLVRRLLPSAGRQAVGPFLFFDHFGPITATPADNHDVRPHPHIGLATVTYLFEGAMMHRDSTGVVQRIEPGAINWMTAGRGIVHSERTPDDLRGATRRSHGLQLWCAVPAAHERDEPSFQHVPAAALPERSESGVTLRVLVGEGHGLRSPVRTLSPTVYVDYRFAGAAAALALDVAATERAVYAVGGRLRLDGELLPEHTLAVLAPGTTPTLEADGEARAVLVGGDPLGPRFLWWNFVATDKALIEAAQDDWEAGRFPAVPGETEFIPLPPRRPRGG
ncbi:pirin family protein [Piscinibacter sakaiensis]|uniref:Pirin-related protein n=1 Tax=Piscinibacter sakaiensis TaxID=1547922 RepID=A0A0K8P1A0_PISS1|nr:pirin family protein [Piscinibacter sakaiensis]GAP36314.1 pirin-related protein [Piscinibacter sakaiensis]